MRKINIGFALLSNRKNPAPSTRISILNILPYLQKAGFETSILFEPDQSTEEPVISDVVDSATQREIDIVYFQKVRGPSVVETVRRLSARGIRTVYGICDLVEEQMVAETDATIAVTEFLKSLYPKNLQEKIFVVHDSIENPEAKIEGYNDKFASSRSPLHAVLVTSSELWKLPIIHRAPSFVQVNVVGNYPKQAPWDAVRRHYWKFRSQPNLEEKIDYVSNVLDRKFVRVNWHPVGVYDELSRSDLGIIPVNMGFDPLPQQNVSWWQVKSENRLVMKMAMGLPVIACPVPAYNDVIVQGENGYLASSREEWLACFEALRDPERRREIGRKARDSVIQRYSKEEQVRKLVAVLQRLAG